MILVRDTKHIDSRDDRVERRQEIYDMFRKINQHDLIEGGKEGGRKTPQCLQLIVSIWSMVSSFGQGKTSFGEKIRRSFLAT